MDESSVCTQSCPTLDCLDELNVETLRYLSEKEPLPQRVRKRKRGSSGKKSSLTEVTPMKSRDKDVVSHTTTNPIKKTKLGQNGCTKPATKLSNADIKLRDPPVSEANIDGDVPAGDPLQIKCMDCIYSLRLPDVGLLHDIL